MTDERREGWKFEGVEGNGLPTPDNSPPAPPAPVTPGQETSADEPAEAKDRASRKSRSSARRTVTPRPRIQGLFSGLEQPSDEGGDDRQSFVGIEKEATADKRRAAGEGKRLAGEGKPATDRGQQTSERAALPERIYSPPVNVSPLVYAPPPPSETPGLAAATAARPGGQEQVIPAVESISPLAWQSLNTGHPLVDDARSQMTPEGRRASSSLAYAHPIGATAGATAPDTPLQAVLLEIIDERPGRTWSEDELLLVEQVTDQLSLALENARLFEEARRRAEQLSILNEMSRELSTQVDVDQVIETVYRYASRLLDTSNFYVALNLEESDEIVFPLYIDQHVRRQVRGRKRTNALTEYVIRLQQPVLIKENVVQVLRESLGVEPQGTPAQCWLGVPMVYAGQVNGVIAVQSYTQSHLFDESHRDILLAVASQASVAIQNANLFQQAERRSQELSLINLVVTRVSASFELQNSLEIVTNALAESLHAFASVALLESESQVLTVLTNASPYPDTPSTVGQQISLLENPAFQQVIETLGSLLIEDPQVNALTSPSHSILRELDVRTLLIIPILTANVVGIISLEVRGEQRSFSPDAVRLAETIVYQAATAIQNARLFEESQRRARQLQTAAEIARDTSNTLALDSILPRAVALLCQRFDYYHASVFLLDETASADGEQPVLDKFAVVRESSGPTTGQAGEEMKRSGHRLRVGSASVIGQATASGKPLLLNDVSLPEAQAVYRPNPLLPLTRAELGIPLKIGERVIGALDVQASRPNAFTSDDVAVLQILADQIAVAVDNARAYELTQKAMEEIREADRLKTQFLANMSHELRTPLNSIIGFSRVILKGIDGPVNEQQTQDLTAIYNSGQHLLGLINDVLDLSKIEAGKMELAFENSVNLADMIHSVMSTTMGLVKDKPIQLKQVVAPNLPLVSIDPMKIRQVLINLLSNAAKFTEQGTITVEAEPHKGADGRAEVIVRVIDSGAGIAPEDQMKLFQPFSQVDGSLTRKTGGSGLGLSICHHLVRLHGGRIGLHSEIGKGSTFFFTLPVMRQEGLPAGDDEQPILPDVEMASKQGQAVGEPGVEDKGQEAADKGPQAADRQVLAADDQPKTADEEQPAVDTMDEEDQEPEGEWAVDGGGEASTPPAFASPMVLLSIDRDPQVIDFYRRYLANQNISVISLTEMEQAVTVARGIQPVAITLDVTMQSNTPGPDGARMDGWMLLEALKADPGTCNIPVLVCTLVAEQEKARKLGADEYLLKPVLEDDLAQAIQRLRK